MSDRISQDITEVSSTSQRLAGIAGELQANLNSARQQVDAMPWEGRSAEAARNFHQQLDAQGKAIQLSFEQFAQAVGVSAENFREANEANQRMFQA